MSDGTDCSLIVRPERIAVQAEGSATGAGRVAVNAVVSDIVYFGEYRKVYLATDDGGSAVAKENAGDWSDTVVGTRVQISWPVDHGVLVAGGAR